MDVVATAGHVDHGKSALVRALTGMEPDRWAEERRRGMTIDLGFAWTTLPSGEQVAFVDVPGHERFITNMLAGVGPVPAAMLVVAADEGWMPQTEEHVRALDALGVTHGLVVVTKTDLVDPSPALAEARQRLASTALRAAELVTVSSTTGAGLPDVQGALARIVSALPPADRDAPVRLWVDRAFTIAGAGTVVTGTLAAGTLRVGDELSINGGKGTVVVRRLESQGQQHAVVTPTSRVAVNLRGVDRNAVPRGTALVTPSCWLATTEADVLVDDDLAAEVMTHLGSAAVPTRVRRLGPRSARVRFARPVPLHYGDRLLLREPASRRVVGATVADLAPAPLHRRGAAAAVDFGLQVPVDPDEEIARRGRVESGWLVATGLDEQPVDGIRDGTHWLSPDEWARVHAERRDATDVGAPPVSPELTALLERLLADPFAAPDADEIRALDRAAVAAAAHHGQVLHLGGGVYVGIDAPAIAVKLLGDLDQPFTVSAARQALSSSRRVVVPLLEHLDAARVTRRLPDGTRLIVGAQR